MRPLTPMRGVGGFATDRDSGPDTVWCPRTEFLPRMKSNKISQAEMADATWWR